MPTKHPRINVTLDPDDLDIIHILCGKKNISMSSFVKRIVHEWLEEYEDIKLIQKIEQREKDTLLSHDEFWKGLV